MISVLTRPPPHSLSMPSAHEHARLHAWKTRPRPTSCLPIPSVAIWADPAMPFINVRPIIQRFRSSRSQDTSPASPTRSWLRRSRDPSSESRNSRHSHQPPDPSALSLPLNTGENISQQSPSHIDPGPSPLQGTEDVLTSPSNSGAPHAGPSITIHVTEAADQDQERLCPPALQEDQCSLAVDPDPVDSPSRNLNEALTPSPTTTPPPSALAQQQPSLTQVPSSLAALASGDGSSASTPTSKAA